MQTNPVIFKAYDIRGVYGVDFDEVLAYQLGLAFVALRKKETQKEKIKLVVGRDMRVSSPVLKEKLIEGMLDGGADVIDIDLASTPTFYFAVAFYRYDGGILVSASHNPKEYNGFKIVRDHASPMSKDTGIFLLRDMILEGTLEKNEVRGTVIVKTGVLEKQVQYERKYAHPEKIKDLKVVIDPANAMGSLYCDALFQILPCAVVRMNWLLDGTFPAHEADPFKFENLKTLGEKICKEKADVGIATDGDGDRVFFVDEKGEPIPAAVTRAILSKIFLREHPGAKIIYDIRPGRITEDTIVENGGIPIIERVGHSFLKERLLKENALFAGESAGHFFLNMTLGAFEVPMIVIMRFLEEISESGLRVSEYIRPYLRYAHSGEINTRVENPDEKIRMIKEKYSDGKLNEIDGISIEYFDFWFNVRKSNTEPILRFTLEAKTQVIMKEKRDEILEILKI